MATKANRARGIRSRNPDQDELKIFESQREERGTSQPMKDLLTSSARSAKSHNEQYDRIIKCYTEHAEKSLKINLRYKRWYFYVSLLIMMILAALVAYLALHSCVIDSAEAYITAIAAFITAFIVLPVTITKYLFNPDESKNLNQIVQSIQKHDLEMTHHVPPNAANKSDCS